MSDRDQAWLPAAPVTPPLPGAQVTPALPGAPVTPALPIGPDDESPTREIGPRWTGSAPVPAQDTAGPRRRGWFRRRNSEPDTLDLPAEERLAWERAPAMYEPPARTRRAPEPGGYPPGWPGAAPPGWPGAAPPGWPGAAPPGWPAPDGWPQTAAWPQASAWPQTAPPRQRGGQSRRAHPRAEPARRPQPPPPPPPRPRRRRRVWPWVFFFFVVLPLACCGGLIAWAQPYVDQYPASIAAETEVPGLSRITDTARRRAVDQILGQVESEQLDETSTALLYTDQRQRAVTVLATTRFVADPAGDLAGTFARLAEPLKLTGARDVPAGPLGGHQRCAAGSFSGRNAAVCGWADHGSLVVGVFPGRSVDDGAQLLQTIRATVLKRG
jgi:hypothetical protein